MMRGYAVVNVVTNYILAVCATSDDADFLVAQLRPLYVAVRMRRPHAPGDFMRVTLHPDENVEYLAEDE